jgi:hypothetical protein
MPIQYSSAVVKELLSNSAILSSVTIANLILSGNLTISGTGGISENVLDDISPYFDGITKTFTLKVNNTAVIPNSPHSLFIFVGGVPIFPSDSDKDYFNLPYIQSFGVGYSVSGTTITFATPPLRHMPFRGTIRYLSAQNFSYKQTPFKPINIVMGY